MKKIFIVLLAFLLLFCACVDEEIVYIKKQTETKEWPFKVHYLALEKGKASVYELPNGECMLIDTGASCDFPVLYEYMRKLDIKTVDYLIATVNDEYHLGGAKKILQNFDVCEMYVSKKISDTELYYSTTGEAIAENCRINPSEGGTEVLTDGNLSITIAGPIGDEYGAGADAALTVMISYGDVCFFAEGDCSLKAENQLLESIGDYLDSDVIAVPNSGRGDTSSSAFLQKISPHYAVVQSFNNNSPDNNVIKTLEALGADVFRTDSNGNIIFTSTSKEIVNIKTER